MVPALSESTRAAWNAVLGDYLEQRANALAISMGFYHRDAPLQLAAQALLAAHPAFGARVVVLVHGMAQTEECWSFPNDPATSYGSRLRAELGFTPLYVRYNTGRHVSQNGRDLAALLEQLVEASPVPIEEIALIGHSLGGLVIRSACHYAAELGLTWIQRARSAFYLGTPHLGSPLEKAGNLVSVVLSAIDDPVVRLIHTLSELRSAGVKDLRHGSLLDQDWEAPSSGGSAARPAVVPLRAEMKHYFVAATLTRNTKHWAALLLGDALVRLPSATHPGRLARLPPDHAAVFPGFTHMQLCRSPEVYARIRAWFGEAPGAQASAEERAAPEQQQFLPEARAEWDLERLDAYRALLEDAVDRGATAVQEVQEAITRRPYAVIEQIPAVRAQSEVIRSLHSAGVRATYDTIRVVNRVVGVALSRGILGWKTRAR